MGDSESGDQLFQALSALALPLYPAAVYCCWNHPLVDHEISPLVTFVPSVPLAIGLFGAGKVFIFAVKGPVLRLRKAIPRVDATAAEKAADQANEKRFLARTWKMLELALLSLFGWYVVRGEPYLPQSIGGPGMMDEMLPAVGARRHVPWLHAAYHAGRFAYLLEWWIFEDGLSRPYLTMHHIATSITVCCAVFAGWTRIGVITMFLHDAPNGPLQLLVWMQQVRVPAIAIILAFLFNLYLWAHFMLYCFPVEVLLPTVSEERIATLEWKIYWAMFALLLVHHVYAYFRLLAYIPRFLKSPTGAVAAAQQAEMKGSGRT